MRIPLSNLSYRRSLTASEWLPTPLRLGRTPFLQKRPEFCRPTALLPSSGALDRQVHCIGGFLLLFDAISEDAQRKSLSGRDGFFFCGPVGQYTAYIFNLGNPAPVDLEFCFDFIHNVRHVCILTRPNISRRI